MINDLFLRFNKIESDRLILRKVNIKDIEDIFEFTSLPQTSEGLSWNPHSDLTVTRKFVESIIAKYDKNTPSQWVLVLKENSKVIGIAGFIEVDFQSARGEIAYVLSPDFQNRGYMTEALRAIVHYGFTEMKLHRIQAKCEIDNYGSEKVMQKLGMQLEGVLRGYILRKGKFRDYKIYSILNG